MTMKFSLFDRQFLSTHDPTGSNYQFWTYIDQTGNLVMGYRNNSGDYALGTSQPDIVGTGGPYCTWFDRTFCDLYGEEYSGESGDPGNDMPGVQAYPATFSYMQTWNEPDGWSSQLYETMFGLV